MKKSEIKDLYNQSNEALTLLKAYVLMLPYAVGNKATLQAIDTAARLVTIVKTMCDYMIDDGSSDMTARLQDIKAEAKQIELDVAKMDYDKERFAIMLNCRAIINNIKDMEEWTANSVEPQQAAPEAPQQPSDGNGGELAGNSNETPPEGKGQTVIKKEDLPTIYDDTDRKELEQHVFCNAIQNKWMVLSEDGKYYIWSDKKSYYPLAYLCGRLYCEDEVYISKANTLGIEEYKYKCEGRLKVAGQLKTLFGGIDISDKRSHLKQNSKPISEWREIEKLFPEDRQKIPQDNTGKHKVTKPVNT